MLKFIKGHMSSITDIEIFPLISFFIFFGIFTGMLIYVFAMKKSAEREYAAIPVDPDDDDETNSKNNAAAHDRA